MTKSSEKKNAPTRKTEKSQASSAQPEHVEAGAEDFEHTLKRLVVEKEKKRAKNFGMYR